MTLTKLLAESEESVPTSTETIVEASARKTILSRDGKKINLERKGYLMLGTIDDNDNIDFITWKQFKASKLPMTASEGEQDSYVKAVLRTIKEFRDKAEYNSWTKRAGKGASFEQKIDKLLELGAKIKKGGI